MPEISIIIPCYNVEKYLSRCLDSVIGQSFTDFEVICVNDGSPDNSGSILEEYAAKDKRIKILTQKNQGLSMARNNGKALAQGKYIYFLDSDDFIHPQCLEITHYIAEKYEVDLVSFDFCENMNKTLWQKRYEKEKIEAHITDKPFFLGTTKEKNKINYNVWTKLFRKDLLDGIDFIPKIHFEDFPHTYAVLSKSPKTAVIHVLLYFYTINQSSIAHQNGNPQQLLDYWTGIKYIDELYHKEDLRAEWEFMRATFIPNILKHQLGRCKRSPRVQKKPMYQTFAEELRDLRSRDLLHRQGHKYIRYLTYQYIMWRYK